MYGFDLHLGVGELESAEPEGVGDDVLAIECGIHASSHEEGSSGHPKRSSSFCRRCVVLDKDRFYQVRLMIRGNRQHVVLDLLSVLTLANSWCR